MKNSLPVALLMMSSYSAQGARGPAAPAVQLFQDLVFEYHGERYGFRLLTPPHVSPGERYPLLVFLHGAGERGRDNQANLKYLPYRMAEAPYRDRFPAYVLVPQCREGQRWVEADWGARRSSRMRPDPSPAMAMAMALLEKVLHEHPIDLDRVYLTGLSMGGFGAWELAARRPGTFAALVPACGGGDEATAPLLASTPIWAWHGSKDTVVWPERTRTMIEAIRLAGGSPKQAEPADAGHDVFLQAFEPSSGVIEWVFGQHRGPARTDSAFPAGTRPLRILCAGDSNTEAREFPGYRAFLKHQLNRQGVYVDFVGSKRGGEPASDPEHEGYSGEGLARIRQRLREGMLENHPADVMLLLAGSNDLWVDVSNDRSAVSDERARQLAAEAAAILDEAHHKRPAMPLLLGLPATPGSVPGALAIYREGLKAAAGQRPWVETVDMEGAANDGVHYTGAGFEEMARRWAAAVGKRLEAARAGGPVGSALPPGAVRMQAAGKTVPRFGVATVVIDVESPTALNPFTDVEVSGEFQSPSGAIIRVNGFCDSEDGRKFLVRFMPSESGKYRWKASYRQDDFQRGAEGGFEAVEQGMRGPVRVDREHPFHFRYEGSADHYFYNSTTAYALQGWRDEAVVRESLDRMARFHITQARVALIPPRVASGMQWKEPAVTANGWFSFCVNPWPAARPDDVDDPGFNPHRFEPGYWRKFERLVEYARRLGIQVSVIFYVDGRLPGVDPFRSPAMGGDLEKLYYRYAAARLAAYSNVFWDISNEYRLFRDDAWAEQMGADLRAHDPYAHMMSIHGHGDFRFRTSPWADFAMFQSWDEFGGYEYMLKNREQQAATGRPMPQVNEEYGYEDHYPYPWGQARLWPARTADSRRRLAWQMTMAGGYQTTGERANVPGYGGWITGRGNDEMVLLGLHQHLYNFWTSLEWWKMEPVKGAGPLGVPCLAIPGEKYVFYLAQGGNIAATLPEGAYHARWYDPRRGSYEDAGAVRGGGWASPSAPDGEDWVLLIERH